MKRLSFLALGALALLGNACEKHHASELEGHGAPAQSVALPHAPAALPTNPAGSGPVDRDMGRNRTPERAASEPAPKFFPDKK